MWEWLLNSHILYPGKLCYKSIGHKFCHTFLILQLRSEISQVNATWIKFYDSIKERFDLYILQRETIVHYTSFVDANIFPVKFLYFESVCCPMYDVRNKTTQSNILIFLQIRAKFTLTIPKSSTSNKFHIKKV